MELTIVFVILGVLLAKVCSNVSIGAKPYHYDYHIREGLTAEQEHHNFMVQFESEMEERKFQSEMALAEWDDQMKTYFAWKDRIILSAEEQLAYIPKWVAYLIKDSQKQKNVFEKTNEPMCFDIWLINEVAPFRFHSTLGLCKPARFSIIYK